MRVPDDRSEEQLERLRSEAGAAMARKRAQHVRESRPGVSAATSYADRPTLKPPVWTWEVPVYFFLGGLSGMSAFLGGIGYWIGTEPQLVRTSLWVAFGGALVAPVLLTSDLGRPKRALNMFRVFKSHSAMSIGAWTLLLFGLSSGAALISHEVVLLGFTPILLRLFSGVAIFVASLSGALLATYTAVLIGATVIPVWSRHHRSLPVSTGITALGTAVAALYLLCPQAAVLPRLFGFLVGLEILLAIQHSRAYDPIDRPLHVGRSGMLLTTGQLLVGPITLLIWLILPSPLGLRLACALFLAGALLIRFGWIGAGSVSAQTPVADLPGR